METTERLYGLSFTQREGLPKFGTDALLLADFAPAAGRQIGRAHV